YPAAAARMHADCPGNVREASVTVAPVLARRPPRAQQEVGAMVESRHPGQRLRQDRRLVEASAEEPGPVQRNRRDQHAVAQDGLRRAMQPGAGGPGQVEPVAMLQCQDKLPAVVPVNERRPTPIPGPGKDEAVVAILGPPLFLAGKRRAAAVADEPRDEGRLPPALAAETEIARGGVAAGDALRRKEEAERALHSRAKHP